ncbi:leucyl aminopeptidase [Candidatus Synchoanobacter obligatus]|uniref:Probable cytosol aminopeptidase n=1 Tax=Candidatus Synchoanobacter obligatus TaxID=2919597 RepID=A0ABT1L3I9_9GAMM|nr:leucyl aminopeptidase [Candidatus Synchoanobacter obligatus]MCP8351785.1 leucyl aminopeptidase [Candidatus Synchoanobacter obligatus]
MNMTFTKSIAPDKIICLYVNDNSLDIPEDLDIRFDIPAFEGSMLYHSDTTYLLLKRKKDQTHKELGGTILSAVAQHKIDNALIIPPCDCKEKIADFVLGVELSAYRFNHYYSEPKNIAPKAVSIYDCCHAEEAYATTQHIAKGVSFCRDLVSEPSNTLSPEEFKDRIVKQLRPLGVEVTVLDEEAIIKHGMNALHGVARGSSKPPFLVAMHWKGSEKDPVAVVGKGVCFDTGGISIKPSANMHEMKYDMGGAGAVTGLLYTLAARRAKANVVGIVGLVENMPDGNAQNPGDVVKSMSGQTIEVLNTDAEGRLVLADALTYVQQTFKPKEIVDLATLTGAIVVSLGHEYGGLFCNNTQLAQHLIHSGQETKERLWQLPIGPEYDKQIDSDIADMQNIGKRWAGSITAAQFIARFIENDTPWAHLDIAGMAWAESATAYTPKGASGYGVMLLNHWVSTYHED